MAPDRETPDVELLRRMFEGVRHCREIGLEVVEVRRDEAFMRLPYDARLVGNAATGQVHGGAVTTLMDTVSGLATLATAGTAGPIVTLELRIDYLRPATPGEAILAHAECYRRTHFVAFVRGVAYHDTVGDPIANCVATFMLKGAEPRAAGAG